MILEESWATDPISVTHHKTLIFMCIHTGKPQTETACGNGYLKNSKQLSTMKLQLASLQNQVMSLTYKNLYS